MKKLSREEFIELKQRTEVALEGLSVEKRSILASMVQSEGKKKNASEMSDKEQMLTWDIANTAYQYILEENICAKDSLTKSAEKHKAAIESVLAEKSKYSGNMSGTIVKNNDQHPVQKDMRKRGKLNRQSLKNSKNVWQMLNLLKDFRQAYEDLLRLESALERITKLEVDVCLLKDEVTTLRDIVGVQDKTDKEKARTMLDQGFTQQTVADVLGKSVRTIKYWVKDF